MQTGAVSREQGAGGMFVSWQGSAAQLGWHNWCIAWGWEQMGQEPCVLVLLQERMKRGDKPEALEMHTHGLCPWLSRNCLWARRRPDCWQLLLPSTGSGEIIGSGK